MPPTDEEAPLLPQPPNPSSTPSRFSTVLTHPSSLNALERTLGGLVILLFLLASISLGLFAGEAIGREPGGGRYPPIETAPTRTGAPAPTRTGMPGEREDKVCLTPECVKVAATLLSAMDTTADPCVDFYQFATGGWVESHDIPEGLGIYGVFQEVADRNKRTIKGILAQPPSEDLPQADQNNLAHLRTFYDSCQNEKLLDEQGSVPLLQMVQEVVDAWRRPSASSFFNQESEMILPGEKSRLDRLTDVLMLLHSRSIPALFTTYNEVDVKGDADAKLLTLWLSQAALGLPSKEYYQNAAALAVYSEVVKNSLKSIYEGLGESHTDAASLAEEVVLFETELARASLGPLELYDPQLSYNLVNSTELSSLFPLISFQDYFASFGPRPAYPNLIVVTGPRYLQNLTLIVENTHAKVLEAYFIFRTAQQFGQLLGPKELIRQEFDWLQNYLHGAERGAKSPRADVCIDLLLQNYGFSVGRYFVQKDFSGNSKGLAEGVIVAVIESFKSRLPSLSWLDDSSRAAAEEKADAITHKIGYPTTPNTLDPTSLERYYALNLPILEDDFFGNNVRSRIADEKRRWALLGRPVDKGAWEMVPSEVNAYYNPSTNEIAFPAGILQPPYFSKDLPEYLSFGAFGCVAGHEITHAFDGNGRQYNKDGMLIDWWTNATVSRFEKLRTCFLKQYAEYTISDSDGKIYHINSNLTSGEDLADAGGLDQSLQAWKERLEDATSLEERNFLLPGLSNYTREQLFFVSFAQTWARKVKPAEAVRRILTDPHSPPNYRVVGSVSNNEEFSKVFGCKAGQPMSRVDKCSIW